MIGIAFNEQVWWYVARSSGIAAWAIVTLAVCWGLMLSTKAAAKATQPAQVLDLHRFFGGMAVTFTLVHIIGLVADSYVYFGWFEVLIPFKSQWQPRAVAWGVIAFYLLIAVEATSLMMKKLPKPVWRHIHRTSVALYVLSTYHGITAGTDTGNVWYQMLMLASINIVAFLAILLALARRKSGATAKRPARPRPVHRSAA
jgi:DMSO/TMAO reductase YedYZ heme-binding membrane subunit